MEGKKYKEVAETIKELVNINFPEDESTKKVSMFNLIVKIIQSDWTAYHEDTPDAFDTLENLKKKFSQENNQNLYAFFELYKKFNDHPRIKNKGALLSLLYKISELNDESRTKKKSKNFALTSMSASLKDDTSLNFFPNSAKKSFDNQSETTYSTGKSLFVGQSKKKTLLDEDTDDLKKNIQKPKPKKIDDSISEEISEESLVSDLLWVLQGVNGKHLKFNIIQDRFSFSNNSIIISKANRTSCEKLSELGWLYKRIVEIIEDKTPQSLFWSCLASAVQNLINQTYLADICKLDALFHHQNRKDQEDSFENDIISSLPNLSLKKLIIIMQDKIPFLKLVLMMLQQLKNMKGGALVNAVHRFSWHGEYEIVLKTQILQKMLFPFSKMLLKFLFESKIEDLFEEFFIQEEKPSNPSQDSSKNSEQMLFFSLKEENIPFFLKPELCRQMVQVAEQIHFLSEHNFHIENVLKEKFEYLSENLMKQATSSISDDFEASTHLEGYVSILEKLVFEITRQINKITLKYVFEELKFSQYLLAIRKYLLLGKGDFIKVLITKLLDPFLNPSASNSSNSSSPSLTSVLLNTALSTKSLSSQDSSQYQQVSSFLFSALDSATSCFPKDPMFDFLDLIFSPTTVNPTNTSQISQNLPIIPTNPGMTSSAHTFLQKLVFELSIQPQSMETLFFSHNMSKIKEIFSFLWRIKIGEMLLNRTFLDNQNLMKKPAFSSIMSSAFNNSSSESENSSNETPNSSLIVAFRSLCALNDICRKDMKGLFFSLVFHFFFEIVEEKWSNLQTDLSTYETFASENPQNEALFQLKSPSNINSGFTSPTNSRTNSVSGPQTSNNPSVVIANEDGLTLQSLVQRIQSFVSDLHSEVFNEKYFSFINKIIDLVFCYIDIQETVFNTLREVSNYIEFYPTKDSKSKKQTQAKQQQADEDEEMKDGNDDDNGNEDEDGDISMKPSKNSKDRIKEVEKELKKLNEKILLIRTAFWDICQKFFQQIQKFDEKESLLYFIPINLK